MRFCDESKVAHYAGISAVATARLLDLDQFDFLCRPSGHDFSRAVTGVKSMRLQPLRFVLQSDMRGMLRAEFNHEELW